MVDTTKSLTWAQAFLSALGIVKEVALTFMAFIVQYERIKGKKVEDELELMKADKRADTATKVIQDKAAATDPVRGIDEFLQR